MWIILEIQSKNHCTTATFLKLTNWSTDIQFFYNPIYLIVIITFLPTRPHVWFSLDYLFRGKIFGLGYIFFFLQQQPWQSLICIPCCFFRRQIVSIIITLHHDDHRQITQSIINQTSFTRKIFMIRSQFLLYLCYYSSFFGIGWRDENWDEDDDHDKYF